MTNGLVHWAEHLDGNHIFFCHFSSPKRCFGNSCCSTYSFTMIFLLMIISLSCLTLVFSLRSKLSTGILMALARFLSCLHMRFQRAWNAATSDPTWDTRIASQVYDTGPKHVDQAITNGVCENDRFMTNIVSRDVIHKRFLGNTELKIPV